MKSPNLNIVAGLMLAGHVLAAFADPYYTGNPYTLYPPACATSPISEADHYGEDAYRFFDGSVMLDTVHKADSPVPANNVAEAHMELFRVACAGYDRSMILVKFQLEDDFLQAVPPTSFVLPRFAGRLIAGADPIPFVLNPEPNTWTAGAQQIPFTRQVFGDFSWEPPAHFAWWYVIDLAPDAPAFPEDDLAYAFNEEFELLILRGNDQVLRKRVPAIYNVRQEYPGLPLSGRLAGNWVEPNASDQGLLLSFASRVPPPGVPAGRPEDSDLVVFLSWFTFDGNGKHLWLTGSAQFAAGATEVELPIERVSRGEFMGAAAAQREVIGTARLRASDCFGLELDYDIVGAGNGSMHLERLFSLEIAGHPCLDYWARVISAYPTYEDGWTQ